MQQPRNIYELKRLIYLYMIPLIVISLVIYLTVVPLHESNDLFYRIMYQALIGWYTFGWILVYRRCFIRTIEIISVFMIGCMHIAVMYDSIFNSMAHGKDGAMEMFDIWIPILLLLFFLTFKEKWGLLYSFSIFFIVLSFGVINIQNLSPAHTLWLSQFYIAYVAYIFVFYVAQRLLKLFAELESAKRAAFTDSLTGIANRQQIDAWLTGRIEDVMKRNGQLSIVFFDIDHFKKVNDTYGHKAGDSFLQEFTALVRSGLSEYDCFGRWGGEEFMIITRQPQSYAYKLAELLRENIAAHEFQMVGRQTASFGVAQFQLGDTEETLLKRVDERLYKSKLEGRNVVTFM